MQDIDASTGELMEPRAARGDVLPAGLVHFYSDFEKLMLELPVEIENDKAGNRGKYLTYAGMMKVIRPKALEHGFIIVHGQTRSWNSEDKTRLYTIYTDIIHVRSGQFRRTQIEMPAPKLDPQAVGSALTYGKRYTLLAALGIATSDDPTDDDGAGAEQQELNSNRKLSSEYQSLLKELRELKRDKYEWSNDPKIRKRINQLDKTEYGMLLSEFESHGDESA